MKAGKTTDGLRKRQRETNGMQRPRKVRYTPPPNCPKCGCPPPFHYMSCP